MSFHHKFFTSSEEIPPEDLGLKGEFRCVLIILNNDYINIRQASCAIQQVLKADFLTAYKITQRIHRHGECPTKLYYSWTRAQHEAHALTEYAKIHYGQPLQSKLVLTFA